EGGCGPRRIRRRSPSSLWRGLLFSVQQIIEETSDGFGFRLFQLGIRDRIHIGSEDWIGTGTLNSERYGQIPAERGCQACSLNDGVHFEIQHVGWADDPVSGHIAEPRNRKLNVVGSDSFGRN